MYTKVPTDATDQSVLAVTNDAYNRLEAARQNARGLTQADDFSLSKALFYLGEVGQQAASSAA